MICCLFTGEFPLSWSSNMRQLILKSIGLKYITSINNNLNRTKNEETTTLSNVLSYCFGGHLS